MSQMPHIKAEVNVDKEREKKKGGLLGLLSRLSGGGGGASGAAGGVGGLGGAAAGGGLLATKAGLIGLVLAGTTVAGGIGMVGWTAFGPGQGDRADNPALQLFASKPKEAASPFGAVAPASADGTSASLNYLAKANAGPSDSASADAPVTDQSAASATEGDATAASAQGATPHMGESVGTSAPAPKVGLKDVRKMGELSKSFGGGGSGGASASASPAGAGAVASNAASKGSLGAGFGQRTAGQSIGRGLARARGGSATRQAMNALGDNRRAFSSQAGGRTYDGGAAAGNGVAGVEAGLPGAGGPGLSGGGQQPTSTPNTAAQKSEFEPPPTPKSKNVTPWQKALNTAALLLGAAAALLLVAQMAAKQAASTTPVGAAWLTFAKACAVIAGLLGLAAVAIGAMISGGKYGQPLQGGLIALAGGLIAGTAAYAWYDMGGTTSKIGSAWKADMPLFMKLAGGAAMLSLAGAMLTKPKTYPASEFDGKKVPDIGYHVRPEERSRYTA